jgi:hypothetical protein
MVVCKPAEIDIYGGPKTCQAFQAAARARAGEQVPPASLIRVGPSVAACAWAQPAFQG